MKKKRTTTKRNPKPIPVPRQTYPAALSSPVPIGGILYFVCTVPYPQFLDWRYSPLGHAEIERALRTCRAIKIWFPKSSNLIATLEKRNVGTIITEPAIEQQSPS